MMLFLLAMAIADPPAASPKPEPRREVQLGSRLAQRVDTREYEENRVRVIQAQYGECVVKKQPAEAARFVITPRFDRAEMRRILPKLGDSWCLLIASSAFGSQMSFPGDTMRYTLADALVRREFASASPSLKDAGPIVQPVLDESEYVPKPGRRAKQSELNELADNRQKRVATIYMAHFGECVVRANSKASYALLMARSATPQESAALSDLKPAFANCLEVGQTFSLNKATLRGTVAMNFYRLAHAPKVTVSAGATK